MTSVGTQIAGRYTVERAVGRGGTGTVWLCRDDVLGRQVAVKQVGNLPGESATDLGRALREARSAAGLTHPHVVAVFDAVEDDGHTWLVMEYVPSRTLAEILTAEGPLDPRRAAHLGAQAAEGLAAAHAGGVVHRDVKPGNLLVTDDDRVKITDFGIALITGDPRLTQTGLVVGTPSYFSPEAARGGEPDPAGDVWGLGASLYEAVEGRTPYAGHGGGNPLALLVAIAGEEAPPPRQAGVLAGPIAAMMAREPADRWTMPEAARELARVAAGDVVDTEATTVLAVPPETTPDPEPVAEPEPEPEPVAAAAPPVEPSPEPAGRRRRPGVVPLVVAVVLLLALATVGVALATRGDDAPSDGARTTSGDTGEGRSEPTSEPASEPTTDPSTDPGTEETEAPPPAPEPTTEEPDGGEQTGDPSAFAETYYGYLPDDTGSAYQLLSPDYRAQMSQADYEAFWNTVESVQVDGVEVVDDTTVDVSLTYVTANGSEPETRRLYLAESGDGLVIVDDEIV